MTPAPRLLLALAAWALIGLIASLGWLPIAAWWAAAAFLCVAVSFDALLSLRDAPVEVRRELPRALALGRECDIALCLRAGGRRVQRVTIHDHHPGDWPVKKLPRVVDLRPGRETRISYRIRPVERGIASFGGCELRVLSSWQLWIRQRTVGPEDTVRVYPDFAPLARFALVNAERMGRATGAHLQRRRGEGTDFHQLREFRIGDSLRQVDWKATARLRRPVSREYQDEREQQVVILLDTGRYMLARDDELSHFDHVLNAVLVLSYIATRQGDAVGLLTTDPAPRWLPPQRGQAAIDTLMNGIYNLEAQPAATDYRAAATALALRQRRRALVVLVSNLRDEDSDDVAAAARLLMPRHLFCMASLRETALDRALDEPEDSLDGALLAGGVMQYMATRKHCHDRLRQTGATVLDVNCASLPRALTETYLSIKRSGRL